MIKITVDPKVFNALKLAFPKPANSANRALTKYVSVLENMLFESLHHEATPMQRKLNLFALSLQKLANKGGQIGPKKIRLHQWLRDNNLSLVEPVIIGSNLTAQVSQVKLTDQVTMVDTLAIEEDILSVNSTVEEIDLYLSGDEYSNYGVARLLYPEYSNDLTQEQCEELFDLVPVDMDSVKNYILWLTTESKLLTKEKKDQALRQARIILAVASVMGGHFIQRKKASLFGRMYYSGVSMQSVNKELRRAVLGNCYEYDIRSSVISWKMGYAKGYLETIGSEQTVRDVFKATLNFLENKTDFMATIRHFTFSEKTPANKDFQLKLLKRAFTAISFGARANAKGWQNDSGEWSNPALVDILKNTHERERFLGDISVQAFIQEQAILDNHLFDLVNHYRQDLLKLDYLNTPSGRPSKAKILAYLYQHDESEMMNVVRQVAAEFGRFPLANVHDAIFFKHKLVMDIRSEIELRMQEYSDNPYWRLTPKQLSRYERKVVQPKIPEVNKEEAEYNQQIKQFMRYFGDYSFEY